MDDQTAKLMNPVSQELSPPSSFWSQPANSAYVTHQAFTPPQPQNPILSAQPINPSVLVSNQPKSNLISTFVYQQNAPEILIRVGLAFVYTYAAISMSIDPASYAGYLPSFIKAFLPTEVALRIYGSYEIILSLWLLSGKLGLYSATLATLTMFSLTIVNLESFSVVFRNVAIFFSALALVVLNLQKKR